MWDVSMFSFDVHSITVRLLLLLQAMHLPRALLPTCNAALDTMQWMQDLLALSQLRCSKR